MSKRLPWGDMPYDSKTPAQVVDDYVLVRGDLSAQYARDQLALWIERYADHAVTEALREAAQGMPFGHSHAAHLLRERANRIDPQ